ncbi:MAG: N-acetylornithine carbamoyltransferase [Elusimicrobiota bacterium]|jgi:N-acetylornithine carbamoyltransferase
MNNGKHASHVRNFTHLMETGAEEVRALVESARALKSRPLADLPLAGKSVAFCFMNPSLRTQVSCEVAAAALGAHPVTLFLGSGTWKIVVDDGVVMDGDAPEHAKEAVPVLARMCDALALRSFPEGKDWRKDRLDPYLSAFRRLSPAPVISLESAMGHPCQGLADLMTIRERMDPRGKEFLLTWAPHVKALPLAVPHSAVEAAALAGMNVTIARPEGYDLDPEVMENVRAACGANNARLRVTDATRSAYEGAHVVYAKSWGSLKNYGQPPCAEKPFRDLWRVSQDKMALTDNGVFMHCLPVRRNVEVDDAVLDGPSSIVVDQAENRLHTAKAVLLRLLAGRLLKLNELPEASPCLTPSTL